ncbi:MAG: formate/nitrite transporter family protein [Lachnospiraceae bacterium]|nr:formate/nitrite transporter family protein [Robinsoniella sp.]MDY3766360.1 formate/nitrite transporter family protein [Lachnospiraceae bacterium]
MFQDEFNALSNAGKAKVNLLKNNPLGYFIASIVAGFYIAFGSIVMSTANGGLSGLQSAKLVGSLVFSVALSFVVMAGAELFTGNNLVMTAAAVKKTITWADAIKLWIVCYIGNLVGSVLAAFLYHLTKLPAAGTAIGTFVANATATKMSVPFLPLFVRGILCNILVCVAVWSATKMKSESGKLVIIIMCIMTFVYCGFEHSIANMSLMAVGMMNPGEMADSISLGGYIYNLATVTLGNMVGGISVALAYYAISRKKEK